ncbi:DUF4340 domain-containing protein [Saccharicrinis fermentans]|uniref:DUF4340 domain-containing protein n=1 Tax=Saccharicrinis fermentans DSM 9555 = JCM 21142 TaxID=869213 RepID=W7Y2K2_9BACT|nr:DUF4340 domain-containing protein [Saccharicrinis fermentans]GAF01783.1 hypothetical protein JCM21142_400 [Saccharicrinis fermentans DSM 9555 = JCM 21142]
MFRKFNLKTLSVTFGVLLAIVVITYFVDRSKGVNTLKSVLFHIQTEDINSVVVYPKVLNGGKIELKKEGDIWKVWADGKSYNGDAGIISGLIHQVNDLKPLRLASKNKDSWKKYELTDSLSSKIELLKDAEVLETLYIGKFSYVQSKQNPMMMQQYPYQRGPQGTMTTYVRAGKDHEVYAVEGFLGSTVNRNVDAFRNKQILKVDKNNLSKISFTYPADSSFTMIKNEDTWMSDGVALDSAKVANYLSKISSLRGSSFTDDVPANYNYTVQFQDQQMVMSEVKAWVDGEDVKLNSSQNTGSIFSEKREVNFSTLFVSKAALK